MSEPEVLTAPLVIEYPFSRTTGPVIGAFFTALREGFVVGVKGSDGRVIVPPIDYDPITAEDLTEMVEVGSAGEVVTWAWVHEPLNTQPLDHPFAWAMIKLDGADTAMLHAVDAGSIEAMRTGMRVQIRWRPIRPEGSDPESDPEGTRYREGHILDIVCFEPEGAS